GKKWKGDSLSNPSTNRRKTTSIPTDPGPPSHRNLLPQNHIDEASASPSPDWINSSSSEELTPERTSVPSGQFILAQQPILYASMNPML
ncbi:hypothetical protein V8E54_008340, partial [Elaphomyces granulatus]